MIDVLLISLGLLFSTVGVLGVLRMPDYMNRFHATTVINTFGAGFAMLGVAAYGVVNNEWLYVKTAILIIAAIMLTGAISSHALARACFRRGMYPENLAANEFQKDEAKG